MTSVIQANDPPFLHQAPETGVADPRQRRMILIAMCTALVAVIASVSGLNVAQQQLATDLGATQSQLLWVINGYTIALAALLLPIGAIGDPSAASTSCSGASDCSRSPTCSPPSPPRRPS
jgi:hypothetical protein